MGVRPGLRHDLHVRQAIIMAITVPVLIHRLSPLPSFRVARQPACAGLAKEESPPPNHHTPFAILILNDPPPRTSISVLFTQTNKRASVYY